VDHIEEMVGGKKRKGVGMVMIGLRVEMVTKKDFDLKTCDNRNYDSEIHDQI